MSTGYGWEGIRQVCATLLGAHYVPERLCGGACLQRGAITSVWPFTFRHRGCGHDMMGQRLKVKQYSSPEQVSSEIQNVTCHVGSHSVTCHPTQVNTHHLNHSQTGWYLIYLPWRDGRLSWPSWRLQTEIVYPPADGHPSKSKIRLCQSMRIFQGQSCQISSRSNLK